MPFVDWSPLALLLLASSGYFFVLLFKSFGGIIVLAVYTLAVATFIALPGGRDVIDAADELPSRLDRVVCVGQAITNGAPFDRLAPARSEKCRFRGRGFPSSTDRAEGEDLLK